jgi:hypothetical protein
MGNLEVAINLPRAELLPKIALLYGCDVADLLTSEPCNPIIQEKEVVQKPSRLNAPGTGRDITTSTLIPPRPLRRHPQRPRYCSKSATSFSFRAVVCINQRTPTYPNTHAATAYIGK